MGQKDKALEIAKKVCSREIRAKGTIPPSNDL
jgi:hypothetical protein